MRRILTGVAVLALALLAFAVDSASAATAERRTVCFSTLVDGTDNILILEFTSRGRFASQLTGVFASSLGIGSPSPPHPAMPVSGAARNRADGKMDFSVTGLFLGTAEVGLWGILDPPDFDTGNGNLWVEDPAAGTTTNVAVDFFPQVLEHCEAAIADQFDPSP